MPTTFHSRVFWQLYIFFFLQCLIGSIEQISTNALCKDLTIMPCTALYKVEFRILEIRISGETNLKLRFLSGNWIKQKLLKRRQNAKSGTYNAFLSNLTL